MITAVIPLKGYFNLATAQIKLLDVVVLPLLCTPIFLAAPNQDPTVQGFVQRLDALQVCMFLYAPAFAIYVDFRFKLVDEVPRCFLAGVSGALAGCMLAATISIGSTNSPIILEWIKLDWTTLLESAIPLMVYGASTAALVIVIILAYSNYRESAG